MQSHYSRYTLCWEYISVQTQHLIFLWTLNDSYLFRQITICSISLYLFSFCPCCLFFMHMWRVKLVLPKTNVFSLQPEHWKILRVGCQLGSESRLDQETVRLMANPPEVVHHGFWSALRIILICRSHPLFNNGFFLICWKLIEFFSLPRKC